MTHRPAIMHKRKPRADAIRNRERVLEAAKAVFSQGGPEASLEAVARRAGVGIGTLYRHFPTREALYEAVYRHEVEQLVELARHLEAETAPVEALRRWLQAGVEFMATKKGMAAALAMAAHGSSELVAYSLDQLSRAVGELLQRGRSQRNLCRCRPRGSAPCAGRHVLRPRQAGLASEGAAPDRHLHRWTTPAARQGTRSIGL
jgi:AcrR family transcriptional regulator